MNSLRAANFGPISKNLTGFYQNYR